MSSSPGFQLLIFPGILDSILSTVRQQETHFPTIFTLGHTLVSITEKC